jgi:hypothetical protein
MKVFFSVLFCSFKHQETKVNQINSCKYVTDNANQINPAVRKDERPGTKIKKI